METFVQQAEMFRERQIEVELAADREGRLWHEEREQLLCRVEEGRMMVDQWCTRLLHRVRNRVN
ncbi:unnamed protein product [Protopolystoma xenopodis]|uniref:Uncharacterized protein n=1 Tax=Protopolystoma xenopodis TaxID=117903 RepID=A0A448WIL5_9PLAT|nr:unnamed protein product [Protopolystoma xenopodis]